VSEKLFLSGSLEPPGDKSITHRALILSCFIKGEMSVEGALLSQDCLSTIRAVRTLGLKIKISGAGPSKRTNLLIRGGGIDSIALGKKPFLIEAANSGTTMRVLAGMLAGRSGIFKFDGDASLRKRDMTRVLEPLAAMGAQVQYHEAPGKAPFTIQSGNLTGGDFALDVNSAQVSTALILAGLSAQGKTSVSTRDLIRDHTTRMMTHLRLPFETENEGLKIIVETLQGDLRARDLQVPADISSAAFFIVATLLLPGSQVELLAVGVNPGRRLILDVLKAMGADVELSNERNFGLEPVADLKITYSGELKGTTIAPEKIASGVDELPILALAMAFAEGTSVVRGAAELLQKESDRLGLICENLTTLGVNIEQHPDGFTIYGSGPVKHPLNVSALWKCDGDHRLAMTGHIAALVTGSDLQIENPESVDVSYPGFMIDLRELTCEN
jgi:3-phosphoshikimate 1-carboxyvinyltransferase